MTMPFLDVCIVGAGISGIAACRKLTAAGLKVQVFEASDRVGGRMHTIHTDAGMIEMGAQWYHGTVNNPVFDLAGSLGLLDGAEPMLEEQGNMMARRTLAEGGTPVDPAVLGEASEAFDELVEEMEARADEIAVEFTSAGAFVRERFDAWADASPLPRAELQRAFDFKRRLQAAIDGAVLDDMSPRFFAAYKDLPGNRLHPVPSGYGAVAETLAAGLPIRTGASVERVSWDGARAEGSAGISLALRGGEVVRARHVIVATSVGVLRAGGIAFAPALPAAKREALTRVTLGAVEKVFYEFAPRDLAALEALGVLGAFLLRAPGGAGGSGLLDDVFSLARQPGTRYVMAWVVGKEQGERLAAADDSALIDALGAALARFAPPGAAIPRAVAVVRSGWAANEWVQGSYSFLAAGARAGDVDALAAPLDAGGGSLLLFAGEATHPRFMGTVHGAFLAGEREADRILAVQGKQHASA